MTQIVAIFDSNTLSQRLTGVGGGEWEEGLREMYSPSSNDLKLIATFHFLLLFCSNSAVKFKR